MWRPLTFASVDQDIAQARGLPVRTLSIVFMVLLGLAFLALLLLPTIALWNGYPH